ncbi:MAG: serine/threonine protein kinase [Treponema sp.]|nr:serine/threonine protein kinase [Treponema sp.]
MIGKYKIKAKIAQGGMGSVYLAVHPSLKRDVIIKKLIIKRSGTHVRDRFKREAQILTDLTSLHIVRMFDYFTEGNSDYIVLEYVDGMSLDKLLEKQFVLPTQLAMMILLEACKGLKSAHDNGIIHRDIKPANILISKRHEIKLADFGIAGAEKEKDFEVKSTPASDVTVIASEAASGITQVGSVLGTPAYMSPEQLADSSSVDKRTDIYSMGVMLYQMVTGDKPFSGDMSKETIEKISRGKYIPPKRINSKLPKVVCRLVKKMMMADRMRRYQSIEPVIKIIKKYLRHYKEETVYDMWEALEVSVSTNKPTEFPVCEPKFKRLKMVCAAVFIAAFLCIAGYKGLFYWLSPWHESVSLVLEIPAHNKGATGTYVSDLPAKAFFFENDGKDIPEVKGINGSAVFVQSKENSSDDSCIRLYSKTVFLRPGDYRIKVAEGPFLWWKSITVSKNMEPIVIDYLKNEQRTFKVQCVALDYDTEEDITSKTQFQVSENGKWISIQNAKDSTLTSGKIIHFKAIAEGYAEEKFGLSIDWYQDSVFINASLHKIKVE